MTLNPGLPRALITGRLIGSSCAVVTAAPRRCGVSARGLLSSRELSPTPSSAGHWRRAPPHVNACSRFSRSFAARGEYGRRADAYDDDFFSPIDAESADLKRQQQLSKQSSRVTIKRVSLAEVATDSGPAGTTGQTTLATPVPTGGTSASPLPGPPPGLPPAPPIPGTPLPGPQTQLPEITSVGQGSLDLSSQPPPMTANLPRGGGETPSQLWGEPPPSQAPQTNQSLASAVKDGLARWPPSSSYHPAVAASEEDTAIRDEAPAWGSTSSPSQSSTLSGRRDGLGFDRGGFNASTDADELARRSPSHGSSSAFSGDTEQPVFDGDMQRRSLGEAGMDLRPLEWDQEALVAFQKNFYKVHPEVAKMTVEECDAVMRAHAATSEGLSSPLRPLQRFEHAGLPEPIMRKVTSAGFSAPTPIQSLGWPIALSGHDMIGIAQTGSGKTLGYLLPALVHIAAQPPLRAGDGPVALVLAPTRELAIQIQLETMRYGEAVGVMDACVFGGTSRRGQEQELRRGAEIVIATPGRLLDFLQSGVTNLKRVTYLVLDEADRMLDMGFEPQIRRILSQVRPDRQTLLWSATWPREVQRLARDFCREDPVKLTVGNRAGEGAQANPMIEQKIIVTSELDKRRAFMEWIQEASPAGGNQPRILVFTETKRGADALCQELKSNQFPAVALHGDKDQRERDRAMHQFRIGKASVLVATDVAQRGLDVKDVRFVVNFDVPKTIEDYVHRIGRTGRAGASGMAITFFSCDFATPDRIRMARGLSGVLRDVGQEVPADLQRIAEQS
eukprot:TRINITY_DN4394_c0_g1_i1.p1 TRINITY_DN4394_c0_g1~~TRINITY_DN4394_c0_g1_i1.p1  ORF type:complete len:787 (+),score=119.46 TRINITY_DN4394_c0_g1_i1:57-2417(+)